MEGAKDATFWHLLSFLIYFDELMLKMVLKKKILF